MRRFSSSTTRSSGRIIPRATARKGGPLVPPLGGTPGPPAVRPRRSDAVLRRCLPRHWPVGYAVLCRPPTAWVCGWPRPVCSTFELIHEVDSYRAFDIAAIVGAVAARLALSGTGLKWDRPCPRLSSTLASPLEARRPRFQSARAATRRGRPMQSWAPSVLPTGRRTGDGVRLGRVSAPRCRREEADGAACGAVRPVHRLARAALDGRHHRDEARARV